MIGQYSLKRVNRAALIVAWISACMVSIQQYFMRYQVSDSFIIFAFGMVYFIPTVICLFKPESKAIKYWLVFGTIVYIQIVMYLQAGVFDNSYYLCLCIVATSVYFNARMTILASVYLIVSSCIMFIFFKPVFFPVFKTMNFFSLMIAFFIIGMILSLQTIWSNHLVQSQAVLYERASRDKLTNLYNRAYYDEAIKQQIHIFSTTGLPFSLVLIDIDDFKTINDHYGHAVGDAVLIEIANKIRANCRKTDIAARFGGDEFSVLLGGVILENAKKIAEKIRSAVNETEIQSIKCSLSIGVTQIRKVEQEQEIFNRADTALYNAKNNGRNRVEAVI